MNNHIYKRLKELRTNQKETRISFSAKMGMDNSQYGKVEKGDLMPTLIQIMELASNFPEVDLNWLILGLGEMAIGVDRDESVSSAKSKQKESMANQTSQAAVSGIVLLGDKIDDVKDNIDTILAALSRIESRVGSIH